MVIEGNWIGGAMSNDFPDVNYIVAELPAGPAGPGTLQFTNCWGMAADSPNQQAALDLVEYLTTAEQQLAFSEAFGPMPSVASAADAWTEANPDLDRVPDRRGLRAVPAEPGRCRRRDRATSTPSSRGSKTGDPAAILESVQANLEAVVG